MNLNDMVTAAYRQEVARIVSVTGNAADRKTASEAAARVLAQKVAAGEIAVDLEEYFTAKIQKADEHDGARADLILEKATSHDSLTLFDVDMEVIVTLGNGKRKPWGAVTAKDLHEMNAIRHKNVQTVVRSYNRDWLPKYFAVAEVLEGYENFGHAYRAGGFPPRTLLDEVA